MKKYSFVYEVRRTEIVHAHVTVEVTEAELDTMTHTEIEKRAIDWSESVKQPSVKTDRYYRADLIERQEIK